jgi:flagellar basal-body rod modification protein FlgD
MNVLEQQGLNRDLYWNTEEQVKVASDDDQTLKQEDFFALLTEQLANQDPTKPVNR